MVFRTQAPNYTVVSDCVLKRATFLCYGVHNSARRNIHNTVLAGNMKDFCLASSLVQFIPCQFHGGNLRLGGGGGGAEILETGGGGGGGCNPKCWGGGGGVTTWQKSNQCERCSSDMQKWGHLSPSIANSITILL